MTNNSLTTQEQQNIIYYDLQGDTWSTQHQIKSFFETEQTSFQQLLPAGKIIEVGCGYGGDAQFFINQGYDYKGIDLSEKFLEIARNKHPGSYFLNANLYELPFEAQTFDGFWASAVFLHVPKARIDEALCSLKNVLKPGAIGFISLKEGVGEVTEEDGRFFAYYTSEEFKPILEKHHLTVLQHEQKIGTKRVKQHTWITFFVKYNPILKSA